jgi:hypothetical protein
MKRSVDYPRLAAYAKDLAERNKELEGQTKVLTTAIGQRYREGLREGHAQFIGAALSLAVTAMPTITAVAKIGERVQLTCRRNGDKPIILGTRFMLVAEGSGQPCGVLVVTGLSRDGLILTVDVVEETIQEFWAHLRERAGYDFSAPSGVSIGPYAIPGVPEEQQPAGNHRIGEGGTP